MRTRVGVYGVAIDAGSVLLTQLSARTAEEGRWTLPGGGIDFGETPREALSREFYEETSLTPEIGEPLDVLSFVPRPELHVIQIVFSVAATGDPEVSEVDGSTHAAAWIPFAELGDIARVSLVDHVAALLGW